jgi:hypothetical protein
MTHISNTRAKKRLSCVKRLLHLPNCLSVRKVNLCSHWTNFLDILYWGKRGVGSGLPEKNSSLVKSDKRLSSKTKTVLNLWLLLLLSVSSFHSVVVFDKKSKQWSYGLIVIDNNLLYFCMDLHCSYIKAVSTLCCNIYWLCLGRRNFECRLFLSLPENSVRTKHRS